MTPTEYIQKALFKAIESFKEIQCRYKYDISTETHLVEIRPSFIFLASKELKKLRGEILDSFYLIYPNESLVFLTENSRLEFKEEDFKFVGSDYGMLPTTVIQTNDISFEVYNRLPIQGIINSYSAVFENQGSFYQPMNNSIYPSNCNFFDTNIDLFRNLNAEVDLVNLLHSEICDQMYNGKAGDNNYALAA